MTYRITSTSMTPPRRGAADETSAKIVLMDAILKIARGNTVRVEHYCRTDAADPILGNWHLFVSGHGYHLIEVEVV